MHTSNLDAEELHEDSEEVDVLIFISDLDREEIEIFFSESCLDLRGKFFLQFRIRDDIASRTKCCDTFFQTRNIVSEEDIDRGSDRRTVIGNI